MWNEKTLEAAWADVLLFLPRLGIGVLVFLVFWGLARGLRRLVVRLTHVQQFDPDLTLYLGRVAYVSLLLFGLVTALGTVGVNVSALVAGLGLTGFALGFALKDIISNALSGILVMIYKPFRSLDRISVTGLEGTVSQINLRYTVLETEGKTILIPNASLFTNPVTVLQRGPAVETPTPPGEPPPG